VIASRSSLAYQLRSAADPEKRIAQRTVYSVLAAMFRDAALAGVVE